MKTSLVAIAIASIALAALSAVPRGESGAARAATPDVLDHQVLTESHAADLEEFVSRVARLPAQPRFTDAAHRVVTQSWSLSTRVVGGQVDSAVVPERRELTWGSDGSGDYDSSFPAVLTTGAGELLALLKAGHPIDDIGTAELFIAIGDLYREQSPLPEVRAALLHLVDVAPDVEDLGGVQDRQGRTGRGVAVTSDYSGLDTRYVLTFDSDNGALLSFEQVLVGDVGRLNVSSPAVISYQLFDQQLGH